jgi:hypothetical protein
MKRGVNRHHVFYNRADYPYGIEYNFRNHQGLVIPMLVEAHNLLHHEMLPTPKPSRKMISHCLDYIPNFNPELGRLHVFDEALNFFDHEARYNTSYQEADRAEAISEHLYQQLGFITLTAAEARNLSRSYQDGTYSVS